MPKGRQDDVKVANAEPKPKVDDAAAVAAEVHPVVSSLLGQDFLPRAPSQIFRYDRETMMTYRKLPLSVNRPAYLSVDFNGEDGQFSPYKWLEHKWEVDGIENRPTKRKVDSLKMEAALDADGAVLSPQRRGFSGGCCPPEDRGAGDGQPAGGAGRKGAGWQAEGGGKGRWNEEKRGGATGGGAAGDEKRKTGRNGESEEWKVNANARNRSWREGEEKKADFKLPFQQKSASTTDPKARTVGNNGTTVGGSNSWRTAGGDSTKDPKSVFYGSGSGGYGGRMGNGNQNNPRDRRYGGPDERVPEWAEEGPTTKDDVIELKGFDEPKRAKNKKAQPAKESGQAGKENAVKHEVGEKKENGIDLDALLKKGLPETDVEFAAILGLLDMGSQEKNAAGAAAAQTMMPKDDGGSTSAVTGSRLSRFFKKGPNETGDSKDIPSSPTTFVPRQSSQSPLSHQHHNQQQQQHPHQHQQQQYNPLAMFSMPPQQQMQQQQQQMADNPMLAKIFAQGSSGNTPPQAHGSRLPSIPNNNVRSGISLEELERGVGSGGGRHAYQQQQQDHRIPDPPKPVSKGDPLQDPMGQATLFQKLQMVARAQEHHSEPSSGGASPPPPPMAPGGLNAAAAAMLGLHQQMQQQQQQQQHGQQRPGMPPQLPEGAMANPAKLLLMQQVYQTALVQASQACGGIPPPHIVENIRQFAVYQASVLSAPNHNQKNAAVAALLQQAHAAQQQQQQHHQNQQRVPQATSMIPASVQRHMKSTVGGQGQSEEKKESGGGQTEKQSIGMGVGGGQPGMDEESAAKAAMAMQKLNSQAAYHAMMTAMQGGLPMSAWRGGMPPPPPPNQGGGGGQGQQNPQMAFMQQQMLLAQAQAAQQQQQMMAMRMKQHQKMAAQQMNGDRSQMPLPDDLNAPMQNPLEKLLAAAGVHPAAAQQQQHQSPMLPSHHQMQQHSSAHEETAPSDPAPSILSRLPASARPMRLEELERQLTESK